MEVKFCIKNQRLFQQKPVNEVNKMTVIVLKLIWGSKRVGIVHCLQNLFWQDGLLSFWRYKMLCKIRSLVVAKEYDVLL